MAKFLLGNPTDTEVSVTKTDTKWLIDFTMPDWVRDELPISEMRKLEGIFLMAFYEPPIVGDLFEYKGYEWRVTQRYHYAHRHRKHEPRQISRLEVEFVKPLPWDEG